MGKTTVRHRKSVCWAAWLALTLVALGFVLYQAGAWIRVAGMLDAEIKSPAREIPPGAIFLENDTPTWLGYAQRIASGETLRVRYTQADNAPYGREVHWSQSVSWLLFVLGSIRQAATGEDVRMALEKAAVWLNPLLQSLLIVSLGGAFFRRVGAIPAGLLALYIATSANLGFTFHALRPDHQGLQCLFGVWTLAGIVLGGAGWIGVAGRQLTWAKPLEAPDFPTARKWFFFSGVAAGLGLWVSAAVQGVLLLLVFGTMILLALLTPSSKGREKPELWRWWGRVGGVTSFLFYLLEYFPHHLAMRLEVNGPLYSVTLVAMGEAICQFLLARDAKKKIPFLTWGIILTAATALLPLLIFFGPPEWHALRDPHMYRLHKSIEEFLTFPQTVGPGYFGKYFRDFGLLPLFLLLAFWRKLASPVVVLLLTSSLGVLALAWFQVRWLGLAEMMNILLALVLGTALVVSTRRRPWLSVLAVVVLGAQPLIFMAGFYRYIQPALAGTVVPRDFIYPLMAKRIALAFRDLAGPGARVLASPSIAPALEYFAGAQVVSSLYWENRAGLDAALGFLTDAGDENARRIAQERSLTYVLLLPEKQMSENLSFILTGQVDDAAARKMLYARLAGGLNPPAWITSDAETRQADSQIYVYRGKPLEGRCRIYKILP